MVHRRSAAEGSVRAVLYNTEAFGTFSISKGGQASTNTTSLTGRPSTQEVSHATHIADLEAAAG